MMFISLLIVLLLATLTTWEIVAALAVALIGVLITAGVFGKKFGPVMAQLQEAIELFRKAKAADSPGGPKITKEEKLELYREAFDVLEEAWKQYGGGILSWFLSWFSKKKR